METSEGIPSGYGVGQILPGHFGPNGFAKGQVLRRNLNQVAEACIQEFFSVFQPARHQQHRDSVRMQEHALGRFPAQGLEIGLPPFLTIPPGVAVFTEQTITSPMLA